MPSEWQIVPFGSVAEVRSGFAFRSCDMGNFGVPIIKIKNIVPPTVDVTECERVPHQVIERIPNSDRFRLRKGDILIAMTGATVGKIARFPETADNFYLNQRVGKVYLKNPKKADYSFIYYVLAQPHYVQQMSGLADGSAQANISGLQIERLKIPLPPLPEQRAIAHILGTLDDKIELNRRMSETLEAMARALFKSWFVDFDPVRAKCRGDLDGRPRRQRGQSLSLPAPQSEAARQAGGLPAHLYDLFPGRLVDSELGPIPEGWEVGCIDDGFELTMGQSPPRDTYNEAGNGLPFYQGRADFGFRFPKRRVYCTAPTRFAHAGDTLISVRAPVGDINMASEKCAIGRGVAAARHKSGSRSYTFYFMRGMEEVFGRFEAEGTVFGSINKADFHAIPCAIPPMAVVSAFERVCASIDSRIETNERESRTLAALRDALLPRLISGALRVKDAERFIGRAV